jgi:hypothetical protein
MRLASSMLLLAATTQLSQPTAIPTTHGLPDVLATPTASNDARGASSEAAPHFVLFNRIPKTGSTTMITLLRRLARRRAEANTTLPLQ